MNRLKVYLAEIDEEDEREGVRRISLVRNPALEHDFNHYNNVIASKYSIVDHEKRIVFGPVILADYNVLRNDPPIGWHYVRYTPDVVQKIAAKYFRQKLTDNVNVHHAQLVDGVCILESFFKDSSRGISPSLYSDIADGSWMASFKVDNDKVWEDVKNGVFKGFSIEIFHKYTDSGESIITKLPNDYSKTNTKNMKKTNLSPSDQAVRRVRYALSKYRMIGKKITKYASAWTDSGELAVDGDFEVGKDVMLFADGNEPVPAPDGSYTINTGDREGQVIIVTDGVITAIETGSDTPEYEDETTDIPTDPDIAVADAQMDAGIEVVESLIEAAVEELADIQEIKDELVEAAESEYAKIYSAINDIRKQLKMSAVKPEPKKSNYQAPAGNADFATRFFSSNKQ